MLASEDHKLDGKALAAKVAASIGATPLIPATSEALRNDRFSARVIADYDEQTELRTDAFVRWDGEPLTSIWIANYSVPLHGIAVLEHPALKGFFLAVTAPEGSSPQERECGPVAVDTY